MAAEVTRLRAPEKEKAVLAILALIVMAATAAFLPRLSGRTVVADPTVLDVGNQWISFAVFIRNTYHASHFPLWDPHDLCGMPFLAFAHTGSLYFPTVLFYLLTPDYNLMAAADIFIHLALAAVGTFLFFCRQGCSLLTAFCAGVCYAFSGFIFHNINFPPTLHTGAWLPIWYLATFDLLARPRLGSFLLAVFSLLFLIFGGDLEMVIYAGLGLLFEIFIAQREGRLSASGLVSLAGATAAGVLLSLPQFLPSLELYYFSVRSAGFYFPDFSWKFVLFFPVFVFLRWVLPPAVFPHIPGPSLFYLGALIILGALFALRTDPLARRRLLFIPAAGLYLFLFYVPPFSHFTHHVPFLGSLIVPLRLLPVAQLFIYLAAARGLEAWWEKRETQPAGFRPGRAVLIYFFLLGAGGLLSAALRQNWHISNIFMNITFLAAAAITGTCPRFFSSSRQLIVVFLLILLGDIYLPALAALPRTDPVRLQTDPRVRVFLANSTGRGRYLILSGHGVLDAPLPFHLGLRIRADTIDAYSRVPPRSAARRLARLYPSLVHWEGEALIGYDQLGLRDPNNLAPTEIHLLNVMNVGWIISRYPWTAPVSELKLKLLNSWPDLYIYENLTVWPRAWEAGEDERRPVAVYRPAPDHLILETVEERGKGNASSRVVCLSESWFPGWRAMLGKEEVRIEQDELAFMRVAYRGGQLHLFYLPVSFRLGLAAGAGTVFFSLVCLSAFLLRARLWLRA